MYSNNGQKINFIWTAQGRFILCILSIIAAWLLLFSHGPELNNDYGFQLAAARHMLEGNNISVVSATQANALDKWTYTPLTWWSPGHTIASALFLPLTGDLWRTAYMVEAVYIVLLFLALYIIIELCSGLLTFRVQTGLWLV